MDRSARNGPISSHCSGDAAQLLLPGWTLFHPAWLDSVPRVMVDDVVLRTGFSSKKAFDWEKANYLSRWVTSGNTSIFVKSTPSEEHLGIHAAGLQKWAVAKLSEQHI